MIGFETILVQTFLAKIHGPQSMGCVFLPNLGIDTGIILQWLLSAHGFIQIMCCKMLVDE
jgi:hypothetical protein